MFSRKKNTQPKGYKNLTLEQRIALDMNMFDISELKDPESERYNILQEDLKKEIQRNTYSVMIQKRLDVLKGTRDLPGPA